MWHFILYLQGNNHGKPHFFFYVASKRACQKSTNALNFLRKIQRGLFSMLILFDRVLLCLLKSMRVVVPSGKTSGISILRVLDVPSTLGKVQDLRNAVRH
ncbi:TPA: hypothetical protein DDW35_04835 [Candidatus Sumerlaeota bacterium]|nr:hypothetical protein [Candidatus Sumerlaeota bacterium]